MLLKRRNETRHIQAVVVNPSSKDGLVLYHNSLFLEEMIRELGNSLSELDLKGSPEGIHMWEGKYHWSSNGFEDPENGEWYPRGSFRPLTQEEWAYISSNVSPWSSARKFLRLKDAHIESQRFLSGLEKDEPNLLEIISGGMANVPYLREDLEIPESPWISWVYALRAILKDGPSISSSSEIAGRRDLVKMCWLDWLESKGW